ncbi:MAG: carboxypeptidase-like regulatory domain-containing protein [Marinilabilia sp.]
MKTIAMIFVLSMGLLTNTFAGNNDKDEKPGEPAPKSSSIAGVIVDDQTGETLAGVEVKLQGTDVKTYTDFDGKFVFEEITPGKYAVEARIISYKPFSTSSVNVDANEMHAFNLELQNHEEE